MSIDIQFRSAVEQDLPMLREFEQGVIATERVFNANLKDDPITYYDLEAMLKSDQVKLLVGELGEQEKSLVACAYGRLEKSSDFFRGDTHLYLGFMYVLPGFRGQGASGQLLEELLTWGKQAGAEEARLDVYCNNAVAIRAYEKAGFKSLLVDMRRPL